MVHTYNPSPEKAEAEDLGLWPPCLRVGQGLYTARPCLKNNNTPHILLFLGCI
jgi:hypothetical protein